MRPGGVLVIMREIREVDVFNATRRVKLAYAQIARGHWSRARGLIGTKPLAPHEALIIDPSMGVHTWFMTYPIDVIYVDDNDRVVDLDEDMLPWRMGRIRFKSSYVIELAVGAIRTSRTEIGDQLRIEQSLGRGAAYAIARGRV